MDESVDNSRRKFLKALASAAPLLAVPPSIAQAFGGIAAEAASAIAPRVVFETFDNLLIDRHELTNLVADMKDYLPYAPTASDAYHFARLHSAPELFVKQHRFWVQQIEGSFQHLQQLNLTPYQAQSFIDQALSTPKGLNLFGYYMPGATRSELTHELHRLLLQDAAGCKADAHALLQAAQDAHAHVWEHFKAFPHELRRGAEDAARNHIKELKEDEGMSIYPDMASARKAGGYPIPDNCRGRPDSYVGNYDHSGERYEHLGTIAPRGHVDITKGYNHG